MDDKNSVVYVYDLAKSFFSDYKKANNVIEELKSIYNDLYGEVATTMADDLLVLLNKYKDKELLSDEDNINFKKDVVSYYNKYERYNKIARNVSIKVNFEDSPLGFAKGALEMYDLFNNGEVTYSEFRSNLQHLMAMTQQKGYNKSLFTMLFNLDTFTFIDDKKEIKQVLGSLKNFVSNIERKTKHINKLKVKDFVEIMEDNKQYIEIFNIADNNGVANKTILYSGLLEINKLVTSNVYEREVIGVRSRFNDDNNTYVDLIVR